MKASSQKTRVGVVGCGLIGQRRARTAAQHPESVLAAVADVNAEAAARAAEPYGCRSESDWRKLAGDPGIDVLVVSTPNHLLCEIACAALERGKDVLIEKPMGRDLKEALRMRRTAVRHRRKLKVGFNHRYHPAIALAHRLYKEGKIGRAINVRAQYGHGGRKGYEKEWRGSLKTAGGGELTDQGVHLIDLLQWFCGRPGQAFAWLQTAFWPIRPLEDNGFALLKYKDGSVASFHSTWTQWKNLFNFEVFGTQGSLSIQGLGGSYGPETLTLALRRSEGGAPDMSHETFEGEDASWSLEWDDFLSGLRRGKEFLGNADEGVEVMRTLEALYASAKSGRAARIQGK